MRRREKASNALITVIIAIIVVCLCVVIRVRSKDIKAKNEEDHKRIEELTAQLEAEKNRAEELEVYSKYVNTKQFVELMARDKLGLVYPNEIIFKPED